MSSARVRSIWVNIPTVSGAELDQIDTNIAKLLNGDGGGTWNPSAPINLGGAGAYALAAWTIAGAGGKVGAISGADAITFGDSDYFELVNFHTGSLQTCDVSAAFAVSRHGDTETCVSSGSNVATIYPGASFAMPLRVRDGAILASVTLSFVVAGAHGGGVPDILPKMRVVAVGLDGTKVPLANVSLGANGPGPTGWISFPRPASGGAWHAAGAIQTWTYTAQAGLNLVDRTKYDYWLEVVDENNAAGTNAFSPGAGNGNTWLCAVSSINTIADTRPE